MTHKPDSVVWYYLATPAFAVADLGFHAPFRVSQVLPPEARVAYYAGLFGLGLLCLARRGATPWVGILESAANLVILLLGILLPIWNLPLAVEAGGSVGTGFTGWTALNAGFAGVALTMSFRHHEAQAVAGLRRMGIRGFR